MAPQRIPGGAQKFRESRLYRSLKTKLRDVDAFLQENGALIAGGSVLGALVEDEWSHDIDLYVPIPNDKSVNTRLRTLFQNQPGINAKSSSYCKSFMRRNGIRTVVKFHTTAEEEPMIYIDAIAVRKKTSPLQVVQNFDLTFCQVWYDGRDVWATHPQHVQTKTGYLQGDYVPLFLSGNGFLRNRLQKYVYRGFTVSADKQGKALTFDIMKDFKSAPEECSITDRHTSDESGIPWAHKTMFRACFGYPYYKYANQYSKEEDGYDSDEYVNHPEKLVELAGSMESLCLRIYNYLGHISNLFSRAVGPHGERAESLNNTFFTPLLTEVSRICGENYIRQYGLPRIALDLWVHNNSNNNSGNSLGNYANIQNQAYYANNANNANYANNENNENNASLQRVPPIPLAMNRPLAAKPMSIPEGSECYDPYMASMVDIADNQVLFYIFNKPVGNAAPTLSKITCIDNEGEDQGQTIQLYQKFLDDITYIYYQCKPTVPAGALFITRDQTMKEPLRRLAFDSNIYVYESQAKKIHAGRKYALIPTETKLGRIVSETLLQTGNAVSAEHCQTDYPDKIHEIFEMVPTSGGMRLRKLTKSRRKTSKQRKHPRHPKRKQTRIRR